MLYEEKTVEIGTWIETGRELTRCPSYYAADHETLRTVAGEYPARVMFVGGYNVPMPQWVLVKMAADRLNGRLYSGFGGNNFASTELPAERIEYSEQRGAYLIRELVASGKLRLAPAFAWMIEAEYPWQADGAPKTFAEVGA